MPFGSDALRGHRASARPAAAGRHRLRRVGDRPRRHRSLTRSTSGTVRRSATTCSSSRPAPRLVPEETDGLTRRRAGWTTSSPSTRPRAPPRSAPRSATFDGGRLVVNVVDMPIKCPVAPLEFCFLADWYFTRTRDPRAGRDHLRDAARRRVHQAGRRRAARRACSTSKGIELVTEFNTGEVDGDRQARRLRRSRGRRSTLRSWCPLHGGADVRRSFAGTR